MRLTSMRLEKYGPFERLDLSLDPLKLNVLLAPNGAGKSVLRRAIHDLLFGIPAQTDMGFRYGYSGMRLTATALTEDGQIDFARRKGHGNTLTDAAGTKFDSGKLLPLLGSVDGRRFESLLALDSTLLREGAEALLRSDGDLHDALFAAAGRMTATREVLRQLREERDEIAPERKSSTKPLYVALDAWEGARRSQKQSTQTPDLRVRSNEEIAEEKNQRARLASREAELRTLRGRAERSRRVRSYLRRIDDQDEILARIDQSVATLPAMLFEQWESAKRTFSHAVEHRGLCQLAVAAADGELNKLQIDTDILNASVAIEALKTQAVETNPDRRDLPKRTAERAEAQAKLTRCVLDLGMPLLSEGEPLLPDPVLITEATHKVKEWDELARKQEQLRRQITAIRDEQARSEAALALLPPTIDVEPLERLIEEAMTNGAPATVERRLQQELGAADAATQRALAKVPGWAGDLTTLLAVVPLPPETQSTTAAAIAEATVGRDTAARKVAELEGVCGELRQNIDRLATGEVLPDPVAIQAARSHRDSGWSLVRGIAFERKMAVDDERLRAWGGLGALPGRYEAAVRSADQLADRRDAESARLASFAKAQGDLSASEASLDVAKKRLESSEIRLAGAASDWSLLLSKHGLPSGLAPADVAALLNARLVVVDALERRKLCQDELDLELRSQKSLASRLCTALGGEPIGLAEALGAARSRVAAGRNAASERLRLEGQLESEARNLQQRQREHDAAAEEMANWQVGWQSICSRLGRPVGESPKATAHALEIVNEARLHLTNLRILERRITGMRNNVDGFEEEAWKLAKELAADLTSLSATEIASRLGMRREEAVKAEERRKALTQQRVRAVDELVKAEAKAELAAAELARLRGEIGADDDVEASRRLEGAAEARQARSAIREAQATLAEIGDGLTIEAMREEMAEHVDHDLDKYLATLDTELESIGPARDGCVERIRTLELNQQAQERDTGARDASADRMTFAARLGRISADAFRLDLAAVLLERALERLRSVPQDGIVAQIGRIFSRLTGKAFTTLEVDDEKGQLILYACSPDGDRKRISELSEGTRDQLFLAMRLALLEDAAARSPLPPLVADDLLQTFDDIRTVATLRELGNFCSRGQVIVLTHHRYVADAARSLLTDNVKICDLQLAERLA